MVGAWGLCLSLGAAPTVGPSELLAGHFQGYGTQLFFSLQRKVVAVIITAAAQRIEAPVTVLPAGGQEG